MFKNYLTVALRNLLRHKAYSAISIFGLAIGLSASAIIFNWVQYEYSFDRHHEKIDRIFRVIHEAPKADGSPSFKSGTGGKLAPVLQDQFPEIEETVRLWRKQVWIQHNDRSFYQVACLADSSLLRVFTIPLLTGDANVVLSQPNGIIISKTMATKFFGDKNPIGAILDLQDSNYFTGQYQVTGVMKDMPTTSSQPFPFDCVFSTLPIPPRPRRVWEEFWTGNAIQSFVLLRPESNIDAVSAKFREWAHQFFPEGIQNQTWTYHLQPLNRIHLHATTDFPNLQNRPATPYGNARAVYFLSTAAFLILFIAVINFVNLTTARAIRRAKEVGVRKAIGASRSQLIRQYLVEALLVSGFSGILAIGLIEIGFQILTQFVELPLGMAKIQNLPLMLLPTCTIVGLIAGSYPAFYLSAFDPVRVLKGLHQTGTGRSKARSTLVLTQFAVSILLLIGALTVTRQMRFIQNKDLGFDREHVVLTHIFRRDPNRTLLRHYDVVKQELLKHPNVLNATGYQSRLGLGEQGPAGPMERVQVEGSEKQFYMGNLVIDEDFLQTMSIRLLTGRNLNRAEDAYDSNASPENGKQSPAILLNKSAAQWLGWENPIGKTLRIYKTWATVVGVVEDFHMGSLHAKIEPMFLVKEPKQYKGLMIRIRSQNIERTMAFLNNTWDKFVPERPSNFVFLDDKINALYTADIQFARLVGSFATLALIIASLGLVGLIAHAAEARTKEMGIRKVLGASEVSIVNLLTKEFLLLLVLASLLAYPIAYYTLVGWLQNFAYRINLSPIHFITSTGLTLIVAIITVAYQVLKAARANPVDALRSE